MTSRYRVGLGLPPAAVLMGDTNEGHDGRNFTWFKAPLNKSHEINRDYLT